MQQMNNRYICRGKRKDNGKWVEGVAIFADNKAFILNNAKVEFIKGFNENRLNFVLVEVIPETVGQYTGLTDKNGKKIFEGDIVYCKSRLDNANMVVIFECGQFRMVLSENYRSYQTNSGFYDINCFDKEVIGNDYDNRKLLEVER